MPNTGRPSRGCQECKNRRVKCDQAPHACTRCVKSGRRCPGYPSESDIVFRNTSFQLSVTPSSANDRSSDEGGNQILTVARPPTTNWGQQATCMFLHDYIVYPTESKINFGYLEALPSMLSKSKPSSSLAEAVSAVALTHLAHRTSLSYLTPLGRQAYGNALRQLSQQMRENRDICDDSTLATVLCLDLFEWICGERPPHAMFSHHVEILETILRMRKVQKQRRSISQGLTHTAHSYLMGKALARAEAFAPEAALAPEDNLDEPLVHMRELNFATCEISARAKRLLDQSSLGSNSISFLADLLSHGVFLNGRFQAWENEALKLYKYRTFDLTHFWPNEIQLETHSVDHVHVYDTASVASLWNAHRTSRNYLLRNLIRLATRLHLNCQDASAANVHIELIPDWEMKSQALADEVCASVSYMLGEIDEQANLRDPRQGKAIGGLFLLWPLGTLLRLNFLPAKQIAWIKSKVAFIWHGLGIEQAKAVLDIPGL